MRAFVSSREPMSPFSNNWSPEFRLICACLRRDTNPATLRAAAAGVSDWPAFLNACLSHSVRATVGDTFAFCDWHAVPAHVRAELSEFQSRNGFRNAVLSLELVRIVTLCRKRKIPVAAFKGPLLAEQAYGKLALREFVDLDVVVHSEDVPAASRLLLDCGYLPAGSGIDREYVAQSGQLTYLHSISRAGIDLPSPAHPFPLSPGTTLPSSSRFTDPRNAGGNSNGSATFPPFTSRAPNWTGKRFASGLPDATAQEAFWSRPACATRWGFPPHRDLSSPGIGIPPSGASSVEYSADSITRGRKPNCRYFSTRSRPPSADATKRGTSLPF